MINLSSPSYPLPPPIEEGAEPVFHEDMIPPPPPYEANEGSLLVSASSVEMVASNALPPVVPQPEQQPRQAQLNEPPYCDCPCRACVDCTFTALCLLPSIITIISDRASKIICGCCTSILNCFHLQV